MVAPSNCDDSNYCTYDYCDRERGCVHFNIDCSDTFACTDNICNKTGPGIVKDIQVPDKYGVPQLIPAVVTGCKITNKVCIGDKCLTPFCSESANKTAGIQVGCNTKPRCDDADMCTIDMCDAFGTCSHLPVRCDDANKCTNDFCNKDLGCFHKPKCDDFNECTLDTCNSKTGECSHTFISCDDFNSCTIDSCDPFFGCKHTPLSCDDGNACTADYCDNKKGCVHTPIVCPNDACFTGTCNAATGCTARVNCDDNNACTIDTCNAALGGKCIHTPKVCNDNNLCTIDSCTDVLGQAVCNFAPKDCSAGGANAGLCQVNTCNNKTGLCIIAKHDTCQAVDSLLNLTGRAYCEKSRCLVAGPNAGKCDPTATDPVDCSDAFPCTNDYCVPLQGCIHDTNNGGCDDKNRCTLDFCTTAGACNHTKVACDDSNPCTIDTCNNSTGCVHTLMEGCRTYPDCKVNKKKPYLFIYLFIYLLLRD